MQDKILLLVDKYNSSLSYNVTDISMKLFWEVKTFPLSTYFHNFQKKKKETGKIGKQKYMLKKVRPRIAISLQSWKGKDLILIIIK